MYHYFRSSGPGRVPGEYREGVSGADQGGGHRGRGLHLLHRGPGARPVPVPAVQGPAAAEGNTDKGVFSLVYTDPVVFRLQCCSVGSTE